MADIAGRIRPSQLITTFGPGSIINFSQDSVMITGLDDWNRGKSIYEPRLQRKLGVSSFRIPGSGGPIPSISFPGYRVCPRCHSLRNDFERNYKGEYRCRCTEYGIATHPARLIAACSRGHIYDFPWVKWAHKSTEVCVSPQLSLKSRGKSASALSDLVVSCKCGAFQTLHGALSNSGLEGILDRCPGERPWLGDDESGCDTTPRGLQKGASNVYFSVVESSLSIPKYGNKVQEELNEDFHTIEKMVNSKGMDFVENVVLPGLFSNKTPEEMRSIVEAIKIRLDSPTSQEDFLMEEWNTFTNPHVEKTKDFETRHVEVHPKLQEWIDQVVQVPRLREVRVLTGFTRVDYAGEALPSPISKSEQSWLPGVDIRGEGLFVRLRKEAVEEWEGRYDVQRRTDRLFEQYVGRHPKLPRMVLIHTLAHLLIRELSLTSGYSSTSIRERLYVGPNMHGFLLYTGSADSDGSLGGLVQHGQTDRFHQLVYNAIEEARFCSSDPLCADHIGGTFGKTNGASCYACSLVSETSCEAQNQLLDRGLVVHLPSHKNTKFFW